MIGGDELALFGESLAAAAERHAGGRLDEALDELGWADALAADPRAAVSLLFDAQGRANATSAARDRVVLGALGGAAAGADAVVLPALDSATPPGRADGDAVVVRGLGSDALARAGQVAVVVGGAGRDGATGTERVHLVAASRLGARPVRGMDPWLDLVEVDVVVHPDGPGDAVSGWAEAVRLARLATAHELVGASRTMLELARTHALERVQFGRPIAAFQAVRHRLAETVVALETADAALEAAWLEGTPSAAATAKAVAGRAARTAARHCQQVLAGIGFTTEHDLHRFVRRILVLDECFGSAHTLTRAHGEAILADGHLPPLLPL